ncbi:MULTISPECIES: hypothetical protein [Nocardia]|uniref:hypothetical protein n=1 Tax=Nocardia TaxID=1817 RepID=UPI000D69B7A4|nr:MULTISPECIES: hypothetical protein [Nocardia]
MLEQIRTDGYARVRLNSRETSQLARLYSEANHFFAASYESKSRHRTDRLTNGYRPPGAAYNNGDPVNEADVNDSFLYWNSEHGARIPNHGDIPEFLAALERYRSGPVVRVMRNLLDELAEYYEYPRKLPFQEASVLQVNSFGELSSRELLQTPHEDGVLATVIWTSAPGLEAVGGDAPVPLITAHDEVLVMPGGIMSVMTGGDILPLYHQARNHAQASVDRKSIMYFSCPDIDKGDVEPYIVNDTNRGVDVRDAIRGATDAFGLAADFVYDH